MLTYQEQFEFVRDGVLRLEPDDEIRCQILLLQQEAKEKQAYLHRQDAADHKASWDQGRGWGDIQLQSEHIGPALTGRVGAIVRELLGQTHLSDHVQYTFTEPSHGRDELNEHRDGAKDAHAASIGRYALQIGILLSDVTELDGPFIYWPGSHQLALLHASRNANQGVVQLIRANLKLRERARYCRFLGQAGDVILSHPLITHGTLRNRGARARPMAFLRLGWRDDATRDLFSNPWGDYPGLFR